MFRSLVTRTLLPLLLAAGVIAYFGPPSRIRCRC
jgi:hypothetical protein